jgi:hypothetical protein
MNTAEVKQIVLDALREIRFKGINSPETYAKVGKDNLILFAMVELEKNSIELSYSNIVLGSYILFPNVFFLPGFEFIPDANNIKNCIWHCRSKGLIIGKVNENFVLTNKARQLVNKNEFGEKITHQASKNSKRTDGLINETLNSAAYIKYTHDKMEDITESEFCYVLQGTMNSSFDILNLNLQGLKNVAKETDRQTVLDFLLWLEEHFKYRLTKGHKHT